MFPGRHLTKPTWNAMLKYTHAIDVWNPESTIDNKVMNNLYNRICEEVYDDNESINRLLAPFRQYKIYLNQSHLYLDALMDEVNKYNVYFVTPISGDFNVKGDYHIDDVDEVDFRALIKQSPVVGSSVFADYNTLGRYFVNVELNVDSHPTTDESKKRENLYIFVLPIPVMGRVVVEEEKNPLFINLLSEDIPYGNTTVNIADKTNSLLNDFNLVRMGDHSTDLSSEFRRELYKFRRGFFDPKVAIKDPGNDYNGKISFDIWKKEIHQNTHYLRLMAASMYKQIIERLDTDEIRVISGKNDRTMNIIEIACRGLNKKIADWTLFRNSMYPMNSIQDGAVESIIKGNIMHGTEKEGVSLKTLFPDEKRIDFMQKPEVEDE
ncbi:hypothetical protein HQ529_01200 [Candidatus Woesearchaeota archaeon]|nr:hypothetical protein [Candidatus Woesearchaeota archaeon]